MASLLRHLNSRSLLITLTILASFLMCLLLVIPAPIPTQQLKNAAIRLSSITSTKQEQWTIEDTLRHLFDTVRLPVAAESYMDPLGNVFEIPDNPIWTESLKDDILILDVDTRDPASERQILNDHRMNWAGLDGGEGLISETIVNHYTYAQIHGYDYKFFHAAKLDDHWDTWVKVGSIADMLHEYRFVVFLDADCIIPHLEIPIEWLMNRWNVTANTSLAVSSDVEFGEGRSHDSKGNVMVNTGFMIAQQLPHTFEMFDAWSNCTNEERYPGCGRWKHEWAHEQRAFSEYIRYDYNPNHNIIEIPCEDASGFPGHPDWIESACEGTFVTHYTVDKGMVKSAIANSLMQDLVDVVQKDISSHKSLMVVEKSSVQDEENEKEEKDG